MYKIKDVLLRWRGRVGGQPRHEPFVAFATREECLTVSSFRVEEQAFTDAVFCEVFADALQEKNKNATEREHQGSQTFVLAGMGKRRERTSALIMESLPPKKNVARDGSLALGISSYQREFEDQSKWRWRALATPSSLPTKYRMTRCIPYSAV